MREATESDLAHLQAEGVDCSTFEDMSRRSKITMDNVARAARVSKQTISAVINNKSDISEKTRVRVRIARMITSPTYSSKGCNCV
ncbi:MAG TPA: LacI family DNA-binding transcriptional regulator [Terrimicrobiaceae bacterium]